MARTTNHVSNAIYGIHVGSKLRDSYRIKSFTTPLVYTMYNVLATNL